MDQTVFKQPTHRRGFLGSLAAGAAALGLYALPAVAQTNAPAQPKTRNSETDPVDAWFGQIKGKHRMVFDATQPHDMMPFAWPRVFLMTNGKTGTPANECGVVVVLRHSAIGYAFNHNMWEKYKFGELFKADDHLTKAPATRNPFWQPAMDEYKVPGIGPVSIGINDLQAMGVMFCVCETAMTVYSTVAGDMLKLDGPTIRKDWVASLLPGIHMVPSGVWALGRAQEHGCAYCFAG